MRVRKLIIPLLAVGAVVGVVVWQFKTIPTGCWTFVRGERVQTEQRLARAPRSERRRRLHAAYRAIKNLPQRLSPDGRLLILTDNTTFSAAIVTAAWAKHYGGRRAIIIGEKIGDRLTFWAESGNALVLPNVKLPVYFATGYHDWASGCRELRCFWPNFYYDVPAGSLDPDINVGCRFEDYRRGVDTVLERALAESR